MALLSARSHSVLFSFFLCMCILPIPPAASDLTPIPVRPPLARSKSKIASRLQRLAPLPTLDQLGQTDCHWLDRLAATETGSTSGGAAAEAGTWDHLAKWQLGVHAAVREVADQGLAWSEAGVASLQLGWQGVATLDLSQLPIAAQDWTGLALSGQGDSSSDREEIRAEDDYWEYYEDCDYWSVEFSGPQLARQAEVAPPTGNRVVSRWSGPGDTWHRSARMRRSMSWLRQVGDRVSRQLEALSQQVSEQILRWQWQLIRHSNPLRPAASQTPG